MFRNKSSQLMKSQSLQPQSFPLRSPSTFDFSSIAPDKNVSDIAPVTFVPSTTKTRRTVARPARKRRPRDLQRSVLVVDDVNDVTDMIGLFLRHAGYQVVTAESASDALKLAREHAFDLVISDIGMPEMNGYELVERLRRMTSYAHTPMIAVTGYTEYDDRGRSLRAGFNAHLTKPIEPSRLLELMQDLLS
jgi:CheY-like chemotaxis protein